MKISFYCSRPPRGWLYRQNAAGEKSEKSVVKSKPTLGGILLLCLIHRDLGRMSSLGNKLNCGRDAPFSHRT